MSAAAGVETSVLCLTPGAAGSYREPGQSDASLAEMRREEFRRACDLLGVHDSLVLNYGDGELAEVPFLELAALLTTHIRRIRPHTVLTFGPEGGVNLHRDHSAVSLAATAAFHWAARTELPAGTHATGEPWAAQKLFWAETPFISVRDEQLRGTAARTPHSLRLELGDWQARKYEAFAQHSSQRGVLERVQAEFADRMGWEGYLLVAAREGTGTGLWEVEE